jgi:hypothetical protein
MVRPEAMHSGGRVMGVMIMYRVVAVLACGLSLAACSSSWMPSFDMPSLGSGGAGPAALAVESDPPGAQASAGGASCVTPCRLNVAVNGPFNVTVALNGYAPQTVPVRVVQPDDPRLGSQDAGAGAVRLDPNPVYVELERAAPPPPPPAKKKAKRPATTSRETAPATAQAPAPSAPTTAVAPATAPAPAPAQPMSTTAPWPMPR